jgi:hypothetical protein
MRWFWLLLPLFLGLMGCSAESSCRSIELGTPVSSLPVSGPGSLGYGVIVKGSSKDYGARICCEAYCGWNPPCSNCPNIDCTDPNLQGEFLQLKAPYSGNCMEGSMEGNYTCTVWERDGKVVAVKGWCNS